MRIKTLQIRTALFTFLFLCFALNVNSQLLAPAIEDPTLINTSSTSGTSTALTSTQFECNRETIIEDYIENYLGSAFTTSEMAWTGSVSSCDAGTINPAVHDKILQRINYFRRLARVTDDIYFDPVKNDKCQESALMQQANSGLSHCSGPNGAPCDTWNCTSANGIQAAQKSNIAQNNWGWANPIDMYIEDTGSSNVSVGHRRWILYSKGMEMGNGITQSGHSLWVIGGSAPIATYDNFVAYPASGFFPRSLIYRRWSFSIPNANFSNATVSVTRDGEAIANSIIARNGFYGDPSLVWNITSSADIDFSDDTDVEFEITVAGISGAPQSSYTYTVIAIKETSPEVSFQILDPYCEDNGVATASFSPGAKSYLWMPAGDTTSVAPNLAAGLHLITITDNYDCEILDTVELFLDTLTTPHPGDGSPVSIQYVPNENMLALSTSGTQLKTDEAIGWWITKDEPISAGLNDQADLTAAINTVINDPANDGTFIDSAPNVMFLDESISGELNFDCTNMDPLATYYATPFVSSYRPTIPDENCMASNGIVNDIFVGGKPGKYTSVSPDAITCRPDSLLGLPNYNLNITVSNYSGPVGELGIMIRDENLFGNTVLYAPYLNGNGTHTFSQSDLWGYTPNDPGDESWTVGLTVFVWHLEGGGMQNGSVEVELDITYPGDPGIPFPTMDYSSCIFGNPVAFTCKECTALENIPSSAGTYYATDECTDANGWTHYSNNVDGISGNSDDLLLLSVRKDGNDIGTIGDGTFELFIELGNNNGGDAVFVSNAAPYVSNPNGWYVMDRYWSIGPTAQPITPVDVNFYYTSDEFNSINDITNVGPIGHEDLIFYKTVANANPNPGTGHTTITNSEIDLYSLEGIDWLYTGNAVNNYHTAQLLELSDFSGGGSGASDCDGCGPLPVDLVAFSGKLVKDEILLFWETATETNNDFFTLEKSVNGTQFQKLARINGMDNTFSQQQYHYTDRNPVQGINYYRLSQTDLDGKTSYVGNIIAIDYRKEGAIVVFPNPVSTDLFLQINEPVSRGHSYRIFDVIGNLIQEKEIEVMDAEGIQKIDISGFGNGLYLIQVVGPELSEMLSFVKH